VARCSSNAQAQQKVVPGSGASIGGVVEMAKKKIQAAKTYKLVWVSPRRAGETVVKVRFSCGHQNGPRTRQSARLTTPSHHKKELQTASAMPPQTATGEVCPHRPREVLAQATEG
jgi:hypothetical protein